MLGILFVALYIVAIAISLSKKDVALVAFSFGTTGLVLGTWVGIWGERKVQRKFQTRKW